MKASKFSDAQKAFILKQGADGIPVAEICRRAGISQATYFNWKKPSARTTSGRWTSSTISSLRARRSAC
ncbi:transposase [Aminobacter carboxidus]|uniref:transposase n=1 Tax=Aminobacter carboxidus TaxID=376165 RepID=UPI003EB9FCEE